MTLGVIGLFFLLKATVRNIVIVIDFLKEKGLHKNIKIIVGGATVPEDISKTMGADNYASDSGSTL